MTRDWVRVAEFPRNFDIDAVKNCLLAHNIDYRILDESDHKVLLVAAETDPDKVRSLITESLTDKVQVQPRSGSLLSQFHRTPVLMICLLLSMLGGAIVQWAFPLLHWFTFQDFTLYSPRDIDFSSVNDAIQAGQYWRFVTPVFLHFGIFHLAFNGLWLWEFGRRIENETGSMHFLWVILVSAVVSNWGQYLWGGPSLFGGMSGVLYALLGYLWIRNLVAPNPRLALPKGIIGFMLVWWVLCMTGLVNLVMQGRIANAAHTTGLLVGMLMGGMFGMGESSKRR